MSRFIVALVLLTMSVAVVAVRVSNLEARLDALEAAPSCPCAARREFVREVREQMEAETPSGRRVR